MPGMSAARMVALVREAAAEGLTEAAEHVQRVARERTPDDPGTGGDDLRESLTVEPATASGLESKVYSDKEYALYQHETLDLRHPNGGGPKFLESAARDSAGDIERIVGAAVRRRFG